MLKKMKALSILLFLTVLVAACGTSNSVNSGGSSTNSSSTTVTDNSATTQASDNTTEVKNEKIIVYTNSHGSGRMEWWTEQAKNAGFEIEIVGAGGGDVTNRLIAEKNNPIADVVFGLNNIFYENLKKENVLVPFEPSWASQVEAGLNDSEGYYHGLVKQAILIGYNADNFTTDTAPKDWTDLYSNPAFKGKYESPTRLDKATMRLVVSSILTEFTDPNGDLGISEEGWKEIKQLYDNGVAAVEGEELYTNLLTGKISFGTIVSGEKAKKEAEFGVTTNFVTPEKGVPMIVEHIAIVNGTKKKDTAERFIEWFGSAEMQGAFAKEFSAMPVIAEAAEQAPDPVKEMYAQLKALPLDWSFIAANLDLWVEKIELQIMN